MPHPHLFHLGPAQAYQVPPSLQPSRPAPPLAPPRRCPSLQAPPHLPSGHASTPSLHAPPPHLAPGPAPLRTPVGGGAHGCARGSCGRPLAGSPTPVALETTGDSASYGREGGKERRRLSGAARGTPGSPGPRTPPESPHTLVHLPLSPCSAFPPPSLYPLAHRRFSDPLKSNFATSSGNPAVRHFRKGAGSQE